MIIKTKRLILRKMTKADYLSLCKILQDEDVMYAYEGAFSDDETKTWLNKQLDRYEEDGLGLYAVTLKENGNMIGQCGLTWQNYNNQKVLEIGYLFQKQFWHKGYAIEAAQACKEYAFTILNVSEVFSIIRDTNIASQKVALSNGMTKIDTITKHYKDIEMPHYVYSIKHN